MKLHNDRQNLRSARQRGTPLPPLPSRRSRPLVDRTDGDDERGVPRLFELEAEGIDQPKPTDRRRTRPEKYSCLVAADGRAKKDLRHKRNSTLGLQSALTPASPVGRLPFFLRSHTSIEPCFVQQNQHVLGLNLLTD